MEDSAPDYITLTEASVITGIAKGNLYYHFGKYSITPRHFGGKTAYILRSEAIVIRDALQQPWKVARNEQDVLIATVQEMSSDLRAIALAKVREIADNS